MTITSFDSTAIRADYDRLWNTAKDALVQGAIYPDPVPNATSSRWGISAIVRPTGTILAILEELVEQLSTWTGKV